MVSATERAIFVSDLLRISAQRTPDKVALIVHERHWTYGELEAQTNQLARGLHKLGFARHDRAVVVLPNSAEAIVAFFGIIKAGGIACILNAGIKVAKLGHILRDSGATLRITDHSRAAQVVATDSAGLQQLVVTSHLANEEVSALPLSMVSWSSLIHESDDMPLLVPMIDQDLAFLVYTSGSTGEAKGVMCPHAAVIAAVDSITRYLEHTADDVVINVLPLAFDHGLYQALTMFYVGGTLLLERDFTFPYATLHRIALGGVTGFPGVPTVFALLLQLRLRSNSLPNLRYIASTGAALPTAQIQQLRQRFPHVRIYSMYGLTECKRVSFLPPAELERRPTSIGRGMPNEEIWLVDEHGQRLGPGQQGELVIRGSNLMRGYWNRPEETARVFRQTPCGERILYSGDLMWMDEEGFFHFVGRRDDLIKSRGEKVYPREVEDALYAIPGIIEAAVLGVPDATLGQMIVAHVVAAPAAELSQERILEFLSGQLEPSAMPKAVYFHDSLPKNESNKIDKLALKQ